MLLHIPHICPFAAEVSQVGSPRLGLDLFGVQHQGIHPQPVFLGGGMPSLDAEDVLSPFHSVWRLELAPLVYPCC